MILTYRVKHDCDFTQQLRQAKRVATFAVANRDKLSSKHVSHIGLKSALSNQILRKYGKNRKCKRVSHVKLIVPGQSVKLDASVIRVACLNLQFPFDKPCEKISQIEVDKDYCYVSVTVAEQPPQTPEGWLGIDRNTTGHCCVAACTRTNKVMFLGKQAQHIHTKYSKIRKKLQRLNKYKKLKTIKRRESNITKNLNHKISRKLINHAKQNNCGIKLEKLEGIRQRTKQARSFKYSLNSWSYFQLQTFVEYKAKLAGVSVTYVDPAYTSQTCSKCGLLGKRSGKAFKCPHCGHTSHADGNAAWNIARSNALCASKSEKSWELKHKQNSEVRTVRKNKTSISACCRFATALRPRSLQEDDCNEGTSDSPLRSSSDSLSLT